MYKTIIYHSIQFILLIPFLMALSTTFIIDVELANGVVSGKYIWFYLSMTLIACSTLLAFLINRKKVTFTVSDLLIVIFSIYCITSTYLFHEVTLNKSILFLLIIVLYFYFKIFLVQYKWTPHILILFFITTGFIEAIWGIKQLYGLAFSHHRLFKITGSFFNPGPFAGYLAMILPFAFYYLLHDYHILKKRFLLSYTLFYIRWVVAVFTFIAILLILPATMSRASWLAAICGCLIIGVERISKNRSWLSFFEHSKKKLNYLIIGTVIFFSLGLIGIYYLKKDSADGRVLIWKTSVKAMKEYPFGVGIGNFPGIYGEMQAEYFARQVASKQEQKVAGSPEYAFNEYLQIGVELGIIALLIFLIILIYTIHIAVKKKRYGPLGSFIALLVFAMMSYPFSILPFLISFVFILALISSDEENQILTTKKFWLTGIFILILFFITIYSYYNREYLYTAYKRWNRTKILSHNNLIKEAIEEYHNLYPYLDHDIQFIFEYARSLNKFQLYEESNQILEKAMKISCDPMLYNIMGKNYQALGNYPFAEQSFNKAAMIIPNRLYPYYLLTLLYDEMNEGEKVKKTIELIREKEDKVNTDATNQMRDEMRAIYEKYNTN